MQDTQGREIAYTQDERGHVYSLDGAQLVLESRNDAKAADLLGMQNIVPPPAVPQTISFRQAKTFMELYTVGATNLWETALAHAEAIADQVKRIKTRNLILDSAVYERQRADLIELAADMGIDGAGLDDMFTKASAL
jgi:hypothetical protein